MVLVAVMVKWLDIMAQGSPQLRLIIAALGVLLAALCALNLFEVGEFPDPYPNPDPVDMNPPMGTDPQDVPGDVSDGSADAGVSGDGGGGGGDGGDGGGDGSGGGGGNFGDRGPLPQELTYDDIDD
jgi:uncharacterized membrane protein YgcG